MSELERWVRPLDALLHRWAASFSMLAYVTPSNLLQEQTRLLECWSQGTHDSPHWTYRRMESSFLDEWAHSFKQASTFVHQHSIYLGLWAERYQNKFNEINNEIHLIRSVGSHSMIAARQQRFASYANRTEQVKSDELATQWIQEKHIQEDSQELFPTDDPNHPYSLLSCMRKALEHEHIAMRVVVGQRVGSLAAVGNDVVVVAAQQKATATEIERVVLHEIKGHVWPRVQSKHCVPALMHIGSTWADENEEGRALMLEEQANLLDSKRKRDLAARHIAACMNINGANYVDVVKHLNRTCNVPLNDSLAVASRVFRGGFYQGLDLCSGLAREQMYLPAFVRTQSIVKNGQATLTELGQHRIALWSSHSK